MEGKKRIINYRLGYKDYKDLYDTNVKEISYEPVIVNGLVEYQSKVITKNIQDSLRDLKVSDFSMASALITGLASNFKPCSFTSDDVDGFIESVESLGSHIDSLSDAQS